MPRLQNTWVSYIDRSFEQIKESLLTRLATNNPEITDHSESNILVVIISMFAGLLEMLGLYVDNMARESFVGTARRYVSMVRLVTLIDYRIKARLYASADISFTNLDSGGLPTIVTTTTIIPQLTEVKTGSGISFLTVEDLTVLAGSTGGVVGARSIDFVTALDIGVTDGSSNQAFSLGLIYVHNSVTILINAIPWELKQTLGLSGAADKHFIVNIDADGLAKVLFGDGTNGEIPPSGFSVIADFETTLGEEGNVDANTITTLVSVVSLPGGASVGVNNAAAATGGLEYETVDRIRISAPLSIRTLDRAVTYQDYEDIGRLAPGVGLAKVDFNCGKTVTVYIAPTLGGLAQSPLILSTRSFYEPRRMVTTFINILAAGETRIYVAIEVTAKFREDPNVTQSDIETALITFGNISNQNINQSVRLSDIIALIDGLAKVDFLRVLDMSTIPYARPKLHSNQLTWSRKTNGGSTVISDWRIEYQGGLLFRVFKDDVFLGNITANIAFTDPDDTLTLTLQVGLYTIGNQWTFKTYPFSEDLVLADFTVPVIQLGDLNITVLEQLNPQI